MKRSGFTLVELLIVMAIISVLGTLFITSFPASQKRARDAHRRNDLKQYQTALEAYANKKGGIYPVSATVDADDLCTTFGMVGCSEDPRLDKGHESYKYQSDASGLNYVVWARLEADDFYIVACSSGNNGELASPITVSNGVCPL